MAIDSVAAALAQAVKEYQAAKSSYDKQQLENAKAAMQVAAMQNRQDPEITKYQQESLNLEKQRLADAQAKDKEARQTKELAIIDMISKGLVSGTFSKEEAQAMLDKYTSGDFEARETNQRTLFHPFAGETKRGIVPRLITPETVPTTSVTKVSSYEGLKLK